MTRPGAGRTNQPTDPLRGCDDMEVWKVVLFGVAALLALKSLAGLMTAYRERLRAEWRPQAADPKSPGSKNRRASAPPPGDNVAA